MRALSDFLWHERDLLELVLHRLETERALVETGRTSRLPLAGREVDAALEQLRGADLARAAESAAATQVLGLPGTSSLLTVAGLAPMPWGEIFREHHTAMRELVDGIARLGDDKRPAAADVSAAGMETFADADAGLTDAVIELELERLGRQAADSRSGVLPQELLAFLA